MEKPRLGILASIKNVFTPEKKVSRADGWVNAYTGLGTLRDKVAQSQYLGDSFLSDALLADLYNSNGLAAKIVDYIPGEMFRQGYDVHGVDQEDLGEKFGLDVPKTFKDAIRWARLYGGSLVIMGAVDGGAMDMPLDEERVTDIAFLNVVDRRRVAVKEYYDNPFAPNYGKPKLYQLSTPNGKIAIIHETRVFRFDGATLEPELQRMNAGWGCSVLQRCLDPLRDLGTTYQAVASLVSDASQGVFKITGLFDMIASNEKDRMQTRMQLVDMMRSSARSIVLDKEDEDFTRIATQFSGIPDVLDRFIIMLSGVSDIPVSVLFGRSASGMNATGDQDMRMLYDRVKVGQRDELKPPLTKLYRILARIDKKDPDEVEVVFKALWEPTGFEQAQLIQTQAAADVAYINAGVLLPEEVALSRFSRGYYCLETEIDAKLREESLKTAILGGDIQDTNEGQEQSASPSEDPKAQEN